MVWAWSRPWVRRIEGLFSVVTVFGFSDFFDFSDPRAKGAKRRVKASGEPVTEEDTASFFRKAILIATHCTEVSEKLATFYNHLAGPEAPKPFQLNGQDNPLIAVETIARALVERAQHVLFFAAFSPRDSAAVDRVPVVRFHSSASLHNTELAVIAPWVAERHGCDLDNVALTRIAPWDNEASRLDSQADAESHTPILSSTSSAKRKRTATEFTATLRKDIDDFNTCAKEVMEVFKTSHTALSQLYHLDMVLYVRGKAFPNCTTCINTFIVCSSSEPPAEQQQQADLGTALVRVTARQACLQKVVVGAAAGDEKGEYLWCPMIVCALICGQDLQAAQAKFLPDAERARDEHDDPPVASATHAPVRFVPVYPSVCLPACLSICLSAYLHAYLPLIPPDLF